MSKAIGFFVGTCAAILIGGLPSIVAAQQAGNPKTKASDSAAASANDVSRYCANIGPVAAEARLTWEMKRLGEVEEQVKQKVIELEAKEAEAREWVGKREAMQSKASDGIVAIYSKMQPEAAASQLIEMDQETAAAILAKLNPRTAGQILNEMAAAQAAKLTDLMLAVDGGNKS